MNFSGVNKYGTVGAFLTIIFLHLTGCEVRKHFQASEQKVLVFRHQINAKNYDAIYEGSSADFKRTLNKEEWNRFVQEVDRFGPEIGVHENFVLTRSGVSTDPLNGTLITLNYKSRINEMVLSEEYIFKSEQGDYLLFNYKFDERR